MRAALVLSMLAAVVLPAADFTGIWVGQYPGRNGEPVDVAFRFWRQGGKLEGKLYGDYRSFPIQEGVVSGALVTFVVQTDEQSGNQINQTRLRFTGRMENGEIELTREREAATNAGNSGGVQLRGSARQTFRLRKLF